MADTHVHEAKSDDVILKAKNFGTISKTFTYNYYSSNCVLIAGWYGYKNYVVAPKEEEAEKQCGKQSNISARIL